MRRWISFSLFLLIGSLWSAEQDAKPYLPSAYELAFPKAVMQNSFALKRMPGNIVQVEQTYGHVNFQKSYINKPICLADKIYEHGIGVHAVSDLLAQLPKPALRFTAVAGLDRNEQTRGRAVNKVVFSVEAGGKTVWESAAVGISDAPIQVNVALAGVTEFHLMAKLAGSRANLCHVDWGDARVEYANGEKVWLEEYAGSGTILNRLPFSFVLGGQSSRDVLSSWACSKSDSVAGDRVMHKMVWTKPDGTFQVRCLAVEFFHHPVVEWRTWFKNTGQQNSPVLEHILSLDAQVEESSRMYPNQSPKMPAVLHCSKGSDFANTDFMPICALLDLEQSYHMKSFAGRSSLSYLPFWNLQFHNTGLVTALGWSGDWDAEFVYPKSNQVNMKAGFSHVSLYLKPGEEISSPSVCLLYYEGADPLRGHNLFRRYMRDAVAPRWQNGEPVVLAMSGGASALETVNEKNQLDYIEKIAGTGAQVYWLDAGWYAGPEGADWGAGRGNWFPDKTKFPRGMRVLADAAHSKGLKFLLWFDPEVASPGSDIAIKHPDWLIRNHDKEVGLYNLGNPDARRYMTDLIGSLLIQWDVDIFRNDFNMDPGPRWQLADEPGRRGITEIRYVEGVYAFWDELLQRKPGLLIDNCASGGRRIDYETCKRSVPLWRSDYQCLPAPDLYESAQNMTYGLGYYLPFQSTGFGLSSDKYKNRSLATASVVLSIGTPTPDELATVPFNDVKAVWDDITSYSYLMTRDFYPLTEFSLTDQVWMVLQYDWPEKGEGCVLCFRRPNAPYPQAELALRAMDANAKYKVTYLDTREEKILQGEQMKTLPVKLNRGESAVIKYVKL